MLQSTKMLEHRYGGASREGLERYLDCVWVWDDGMGSRRAKGVKSSRMGADVATRQLGSAQGAFSFLVAPA